MEQILFLWAQDVSKFTSLVQSIDKDSVSRILILGNEIKMEDLKALQALQMEFEVDSADLEEKELSEVFILGQVYERHCGLLLCSPLSKKASDFAKRMGIPTELLLPKKNTGKKTGIVKKEKTKKVSVPSKEESPVKQVASLEQEEKGTSSKPGKKPEAEQTPPRTETSTVKREAPLLAMIEQSRMTPEEKKFFSKPGNLSMLEDVIRKAPTVESLPFQLKMTFGEKALAMEMVLKKQFEKVKKEL